MEISGEKLKIARHLAGYSTTNLAKELGITKQSLSQYENGVEVKPEIYIKLLQILKIDKDFLTIPLKTKLNIKNTFFRASASATAAERKYQETKTTILGQLYLFLSDYLNFPKLNLPKFIDENSMSIEEKAYILRQFWGLGDKPISNMIKCLENNGIIVSTFNSGNSEQPNKIDGYTQQFTILKDNKFETLFCVVVENDGRSLSRKNFSLAHELGHIILHRDDDFNEKTKVEQAEIEKEANDFAAAFLMPKLKFSEDLKFVKNLDSFITLKQKWFVSIGAMMIRAKELGFLTEQDYIKLIKNYSYRRYRLQEPLDDVFAIHKPQLFKQSFELLFKSGYSLEKFKDELKESGLAMSINLIEDILGLDNGFFNKYDADSDRIVIDFKKYFN